MRITFGPAAGIAVVGLAAVCARPAFAENGLPTPHLGVMVVVDQLGANELDLLPAALRDFGGLQRRGAAWFDAYYSYSATETAPGHATLSTGANPATHGICANSWFAGTTPVYAVDDPAKPVLGTGGKLGRSARFLEAATLGDTLKGHDARSRVISISVKDRSAILSAGRAADAVVWYEPSIGRFTTSEAYGGALPAWAQDLAVSLPEAAFASGTWAPLPEVAALKLPDDRAGESGPAGFTPVFPHDLSGLPADKRAKAYVFTPQAIEAEFALAKAAIASEKLGRGPQTDLLILAVSGTDYIGHAWGPGSVEKIDAIERTSRLLKQFLVDLDAGVGKGNWALVVTSDHGIAPLVEESRKGGVASERVYVDAMQAAAAAKVPDAMKKRVVAVFPPYVYLDFAGLEASQRRALIQGVMDGLAGVTGITPAVVVGRDGFADPLGEAAAYPGRCGPVILDMKPFFVFAEPAYKGGTNHGTGNLCDRRVPLFVAGPRVAPGRYAAPIDPRDAAPTLAAMLGIPPPERASGRPAPCVSTRAQR